MKPIKKAPRPTVEMSKTFVAEAVVPVLSENPMVRAAVAGVYEGRQLTGLYRLEITGARLVPQEPEPGTVS